MERSDAIYDLVRALRAAALPRNRNFEAHSTAEARAARRIVRFLRGLEADVLRAERVRVTLRRDGGAVLELTMPSVKLLRTVELDAPAYAILVENRACAARIAGDVRTSRVA